MKTVGVRAFKNRLSQYLQYVKDGETVIITERNKVIAEISMPDNTSDEAAFEEKLRLLSKEGDVILAKRNKSCAKLPKITEHLDWMSVYNEVRADRF